MRVISIDPGYDRVGIAVLEKEKSGKEKVIFSECFTTIKTASINKRIFTIGKRIHELILEFKPEYMAIEGLFFSKNTKTGLSVAEARGVIIFQAIEHNIPVYEYTPNQIKIAVTGYGSAQKKDILFMVSKILNLDNSKKRIDDELDALAVGLTFLASYREYKK